MSPQRIQLRRTKGWRKPEGAIVVARPSRWGNPFPVNGDWSMWTAVALGWNGNPAGRRNAALALHRAWLLGEQVQMGPHTGSTEGGFLTFSDGTERSFTDHVHGIAATAASLCTAPRASQPPAPGDFAELRGRDLACWCQLDLPCHADVLLEVANR